MTAVPGTRLTGLSDAGRPHEGAEGDSALRVGLTRLVASRPQRVTLVVIACTLMGLTDLLCTMAYVGHIGMIEQNPLARAIIERGGAVWLVAFKLLTMLVTGGCIYLSRRHAMGERCAWLCCVLLCTLMVHWVGYNRDIVSPESVEHIMHIATAPETIEMGHWVRFED